MHQHPIHFHNLFNTFQNLNKEEKLPRVQRHTGVGTTVTDCQYILGQILNPVYSGSGSGIARIRITGDLDVTMLQKSTVSTEQNTEKYRVLNYCTTRNTSKLRWYRNASMKTQLFVLPNLNLSYLFEHRAAKHR